MGDVITPSPHQWDPDFRAAIERINAIVPAHVVAIVIFDATPTEGTALGVFGVYDWGYFTAAEVRSPDLGIDEPSEFVSELRGMDKDKVWEAAVRLAAHFNVSVVDASHDAAPTGLSS
jgi:hypothetical protein